MVLAGKRTTSSSDRTGNGSDGNRLDVDVHVVVVVISVVGGHVDVVALLDGSIHDKKNVVF